MPGYQVFVERPSSVGPDAIARLASAMAERYGIARADLEPRLRAGRFRVKGNVDLATAERFAADLEKLGAIVSVVDERGAPVKRPRPEPSAPPARPTPKPQLVSGLAAAYGAPADEPDLGALGDASSGSFALSALDGSDDRVAAPPLAPEGAPLPASIGPAIAPPVTPAPRAAPSGGDLFAPPAAEDELVDLAVDVADVRSQRAAATSTPPPVARTSGRVSAPPPLDPPHAPATPSKSLGDHLRAFAGHRRARFATGAVLAVLVGFVPAHFLASVRERSAYAEIDTHLHEQEAKVRTMEQWQALDQLRDGERDEKLAEKHSIAITAVLLWAAVSAGFAFVWYRKIDWDRLAGA
jgi:hypothetical protein